MYKYAILANPGHNRVYFDTSKKMSKAELNIVLSKMTDIFEINEEMISNIYYITFKTNIKLDDEQLKNINKLSFAYAVFSEIKIEDKFYLEPILRNTNYYLDEGISSILKYTGKTNELFTRMMLNVAVNSLDSGKNENVKVLDPIAGKGTTLYEALINGYDAYGVEIGDKVATEAFNFIKKYLEKAKLKHSIHKEKISGANKKFKASKYSVNIFRTKEEQKNKQYKTWELVSGNSMYCDTYFKKNFFDVIVGDLPYGVQHGNVTKEKQSSITRNPDKLIDSCAKSWFNVLKKGGVIVLAWNNFVLPRDKFEDILKSHGFTVLNDDEYLQFEHRVDQAIRRDIIIAKK